MQFRSSLPLAPAERECAEIRADRTGHARAADGAVEDPVVRLGVALRRDAELDGRAVEGSGTDIAGAAVAGVCAADAAIVDMKRCGDAHVACGAFHGHAPGAVERRRASPFGRRRTELHFASVDEDARDLRLVI